jgi:dimethylargininase
MNHGACAAGDRPTCRHAERATARAGTACDRPASTGSIDGIDRQHRPASTGSIDRHRPASTGTVWLRQDADMATAPRSPLPDPRGTALVRLPGPRLAEGIVTHVARSAVDLDRAREQHAGYVAALAAAGWSVREVPAADDHPDAVFVEDTVVVVEDLAMLTRPGAPERRGEVLGTARAVEALGLRTARITEPGHLDGGDVLQVGRTVYVGRGGRTDGEGIRQLRRIVAPLGRTVVPVPLRAVLHLKSAVTALPDATLVGLPELLDTAALPTLREVPEEGGAHVVPIGEGTVLMATSAPRTREWLLDLGFDVVAVDIAEFEKLEGCVTCLSVLVPGR